MYDSSDKELSALVQNGYNMPRFEARHNLPILAAVSLASKKNLSSLSPDKLLIAYEKEIESLQTAAMKRYG